MTLAPVKPTIKLEDWPVAPEPEKEDLYDNPTFRILRRARALIARPRGWIKDRAEDDQGRVCMVGATARAARELNSAYSREADMWLLVAIRARHPECGSIPYFNDAKTTRKHMVLKIFDDAMALFYANEGKGK